MPVREDDYFLRSEVPETGNSMIIAAPREREEKIELDNGLADDEAGSPPVSVRYT
jgi:hypothetical protein